MNGLRLLLPLLAIAIVGCGDDGIRKGAGRLHFVRVALEDGPGGIHASPAGNQSSGVLTSMIRGQGLAVIPLESESVPAGAIVDVQVLDPGFFDRVERGF